MAAKPEDLTAHRESRRSESESKGRIRRAGRGCPVCGAAAAGRFRPFCSARCADIDLARWLNESYRVPGDPVERPSESEKSEPD